MRGSRVLVSVLVAAAVTPESIAQSFLEDPPGAATVTSGNGANSSTPTLPSPLDPEHLYGRGVCENIGNSYKCALAIEAHQLASAGGWVSRRNGEICFRITSGGQVCVADEEPIRRTQVESFAYLGTLERPRYHVLHRQFWEWSEILLVNAANGRKVRVDSIPVPAPDTTYLAVTNGDLFVAGDTYNRISIWQVHDDDLEMVWSIQPDLWEPGLAHWLDNTEVEVERRVEAPGPRGARMVTVDTALVELGQAGWSIVEPAGHQSEEWCQALLDQKREIHPLEIKNLLDQCESEKKRDECLRCILMEP